jgi:nucleotide-binding universal stress UspA family protein
VTAERIETIVVPLDGSELAKGALAPARSLSKMLGSRILLLSTHWEDGMGTAQDHLDTMAAALAPAPVDTLVIHDRDAPAAILTAARAPGSVVCMSTHGRSGLTEALLGSVAEAVVRAAVRPLLLVGPAVVDPGALVDGGELLVAVDGTDESEVSVATAARWSPLLDLQPRIVQVLPAGRAIVGAPRAAESAYVRGLARRLVDVPRPARWEVLHALDPATAIVSDAKRTRATLVAVASRGRSTVARLVLGSIAGRIIHSSPCPVLVTPVPA